MIMSGVTNDNGRCDRWQCVMLVNEKWLASVDKWRFAAGESAVKVPGNFCLILEVTANSKGQEGCPGHMLTLLWQYCFTTASRLCKRVIVTPDTSWRSVLLWHLMAKVAWDLSERRSCASVYWQNTSWRSVLLWHSVAKVAWDSSERRSCASVYWQIAILHLQVHTGAVGGTLQELLYTTKCQHLCKI